jgi:hypothetical protein
LIAGCVDLERQGDALFGGTPDFLEGGLGIRANSAAKQQAPDQQQAQPIKGGFFQHSSVSWAITVSRLVAFAVKVNANT